MSLNYLTTSTINAANKSINTVLIHFPCSVSAPPSAHLSGLLYVLSAELVCFFARGEWQTWEIVTQSNWFNQSKRCAALLYPPDWTLKPEPQYPRSPVLLWASAVYLSPWCSAKKALWFQLSLFHVTHLHSTTDLWIETGGTWLAAFSLSSVLFFMICASQAVLTLNYGFPNTMS